LPLPPDRTWEHLCPGFTLPHGAAGKWPNGASAAVSTDPQTDDQACLGTCSRTDSYLAATRAAVAGCGTSQESCSYEAAAAAHGMRPRSGVIVSSRVSGPYGRCIWASHLSAAHRRVHAQTSVCAAGFSRARPNVSCCSSLSVCRQSFIGLSGEPAFLQPCASGASTRSFPMSPPKHFAKDW
jgi:hypothetical protein